MKTTVLVFHPRLENGSTSNKALADAAQAAGFEVRDMYALYPDFAIDVAAEKAVLEDADRIILQFPMYWYSSPALLKQWFDDVLEYGWAYGGAGTALQGKEYAVAVTQGAPADAYTPEGRYEVTADELLKPYETIRFLTGMTYRKPFVIAGVLSISDEALAQAQQDYVSYLNQ